MCGGGWRLLGCYQTIAGSSHLTERHKIVLKHEILMSWVMSENALVVKAVPRTAL